MSLLNDALRDLERRDAGNRAPVSAIPAGLRERTPPGRFWVPCVVGVAVVAVAGGFFLLSPDWLPSVPGNVKREAQAEAPAGQPVADSRQLSQLEVPPSLFPVEGELQLSHAKVASIAPAPAKAIPPPDPLPEAGPDQVIPAERPVAISTREVNSGPQPTLAKNQPAQADSSPQALTGTEADRPAAAAEPIKQMPQSAAARDRQLAPRLERLLIEGNEEQAGRILEAAVGEGYSMPRSHAAIARYYLAQERLMEARRWLPETLVAKELDLRLLQGRLTLLADGPEAALAYLAAVRPEVSKAPDYVATLASLYQQTGRYGAAGEHWIALLETNGRRADWWLGLALALDAQDQLRGAHTAYSEALALPDISPRLRAFAQSRLDVLP